MNKYNLLLEKISKNIIVFDRDLARQVRTDYDQLYVVFEFECYLDAGEINLKNEDPEPIDYGGDTSYINDYNYEYDQWMDILKNYFSARSSDFRLLNAAFEEWKQNRLDYINDEKFLDDDEKEKERQNIQEIKQYFEMEFPKALDDVIYQFSFEPLFGWKSEEDGEFYIEEPFPIYPEEEDNDIDSIRENLYYNIANQLSSFFSEEIDVYTEYHAAPKDPSHWTIEPDSSLEETLRNQLISVEIVSPWISGEQALDYLIKFKTMFDDMDGETNRKTGCHINIRFKEDVSIDWIKLLFLAQDEKDLYQFGREYNTYASPSIKSLKREFSAHKNMTPNELMSNTKIQELILKIFQPKKYEAINLLKFMNDKKFSPDQISGENLTGRQGFVEFRGPGNDYLNSKFQKTKNVLMKYMNLMLSLHSHNTELESEYQVRLSRFIHSIQNQSIENKSSNKEVILFLNKKYSTLAPVLSEIQHYQYILNAKKESFIQPLFFSRKEIDKYHLKFIFESDYDNNIWLWLLYYKLVTQKKLVQVYPLITKFFYKLINKNLITEADIFSSSKYFSRIFSIYKNPLNDIIHQLFPQIEEQWIPGQIREGGLYVGDFQGQRIILASDEFYFRVSWQLGSQSIPGARSKDDGQMNTHAIAASTHDLTQFPGLDCIYFTRYMGFDDWFIPAVNQLKFIFDHIEMINMNDYFKINTFGPYWSSTQVNAQSAYGIFPGSEKLRVIENEKKHFIRYIRAIKIENDN